MKTDTEAHEHTPGLLVLTWGTPCEGSTVETKHCAAWPYIFLGTWTQAASIYCRHSCTHWELWLNPAICGFCVKCHGNSPGQAIYVWRGNHAMHVGSSWQNLEWCLCPSWSRDIVYTGVLSFVPSSGLVLLVFWSSGQATVVRPSQAGRFFVVITAERVYIYIYIVSSIVCQKMSKGHFGIL